MTVLQIGVFDLPLNGTPIAIPGTRKIMLGFDGDVLVTLGLARASIGWLASLTEAVEDVVRQEAGPLNQDQILAARRERAALNGSPR